MDYSGENDSYYSDDYESDYVTFTKERTVGTEKEKDLSRGVQILCKRMDRLTDIFVTEKNHEEAYQQLGYWLTKWNKKAKEAQTPYESRYT